MVVRGPDWEWGSQDGEREQGVEVRLGGCWLERGLGLVARA